MDAMEKQKHLRGQLEERRAKLAKVFEEAGSDLDFTKVASLEGDTAAKVDAVRSMNAELNDLQKELEGVDEMIGIKQRTDELSKLDPHPGHVDPEEKGKVEDAEWKSLGDQFIESDAFKGYKRGQGIGPVATLDLGKRGIKTLFDEAAGWAPQALRTGKVVEAAVRPIQVTDLFPTTTTSMNAVVFMEETTFTNNAAEAAEGATYGEAALELTEKSSAVRKIAVWIPVTDEQLEDVPQVSGYLNNRLPFMIQQRLDSQLLGGDGIAPNLRGLVNVVGIQTQAKGADPTPDAVYKAMTKVRVTGRAIPSAAIFHSTDWQNVKLLRTADGLYIWGSPSEVTPDRIWGLPVAQEDSQAAGNAFLGDFANFSELSVRRGIEVQISNSHDTFFINGKQAIRADMRVAAIFYRPAAFCEITGL